MPRSQKPIVAIICSDKIDYINLSKFLRPDIGQIIYDPDTGVAAEIITWCRSRKIEVSRWEAKSLPHINNIEMLHQDMLNYCDKAILFRSCDDDAITKAAMYCSSMSIPYRLHLVDV